MSFKYVKPTTVRMLKELAVETKPLHNNYTAIEYEKRLELSDKFAYTFRNFVEFAELGMQYLGFKMSRIQADIAEFMQKGHKKRMVSAQRGQAKSTLAALYCIWLLIQDNSRRVLIVSGGGSQASDVALLIQRIIMQWHILCWLRPDVSAGDRNSIENFDIHFELKGIDKSASIACVGITAQLQGKRADFILADDVETQKNSTTQVMRDQLALYIKEFAAICITGDIMYLGTPQTKDSIYRLLPARGYDVRVWTGRYPTNEELERYGVGMTIAPLIMQELVNDPELQTGGGITGKRGKPTDPDHISEEILQEKELEYGDEGFALQYMLDTTLSDAMRTKIKLSDMPVIDCGHEQVPETVHYLADASKLVKEGTPATKDIRMYYAAALSNTFVPFEYKCMIVDPAGTGGDEISFAGGGATNSYIYLLTTGGFVGGTTEKNLVSIIEKMLELEIYILDVEKNMGHGAVTALFLAQLDKLRHYCTVESDEVKPILDRLGLNHRQLNDKLRLIGVEDYHVTGQKERRIIDTISPVTRRHKLVVTKQAIEDDWNYCQAHAQEKRLSFSAFYQMSNITYDRNSLVHDDRADCIQRLVEKCVPFLSKDDEKAAVVRQEKEYKEFLDNPMGYVDNGYKRTVGRSTVVRNVRRGRR